MLNDQTQPEVKPGRQPERLSLHRVLQITDIMRCERRLPFEVCIDRHDDAKRDAHAGRGNNHPGERAPLFH